MLSQLIWFDRKGTRLATLGDEADYVDVALSPDGSHAATSRMNPAHGTRDLWIFDVVRGLGERFTFESGDDFGPNWSRPDGDRIVFSSLRQGSVHLYEKAARAPAARRSCSKTISESSTRTPPADGRFLVYVAGGGIIGRSDIWILPRLDRKKASPFLETTFIESQPQFSPDGRWVAFMSDKSGRREVYVTQFPARNSETLVSSGRRTVCRDGTATAERFCTWRRWHADRRPRSMAARRTSRSARRDRSSRSVRVLSRLDAYPYDVTSDGQRILVNTFVEEVTPPITLVVNWPASR